MYNSIPIFVTYTTSILKIKSLRTVKFQPENDRIGGYRKNFLVHFQTYSLSELHFIKHVRIAPYKRYLNSSLNTNFLFIVS